MNGTPEPMDAERLKDLRDSLDEALAEFDPRFGFPLQSYTRELLDAYDFFRKRAEVNASDIEDAGVTIEKCEAWLMQNGWVLASHPNNAQRTWWKDGRDAAHIWGDSLRPLMCIAVVITLRARDAKRPAFDILEEMAAL